MDRYNFSLSQDDVRYIQNKHSFRLKHFLLKQLLVSVSLVAFSLFGSLQYFSSYDVADVGPLHRIIIIVCLLAVFLSIFYLVRFVQGLSFIKIQTLGSIDENIAFIKLFLMHKNIQHEIYGNVIQISGKKLESSLNVQEKVFFIATDKYILVNRAIANSLIINSGWILPYSSNYKILINSFTSMSENKLHTY